MIYLAGTDFSHLTNDELIKGIKALDLPDYIRSKAYGIDVRETLAQMTEMTIQLGVNMGLSPDEALNWARKLQESVSQSEFDSWVATLLDGGPSIFMNTLSELQTTYPNGAAGVALVRETDPAKIYVWNGSTWEDFGDYQGIEIKNGTVTTEKIADNAVTPDVTTFAKQGKNLFTGKLHDIGLGGVNSNVISDAEGYLSAIVPVKPNTKYTVTTFDELTIKRLGTFSEYPTSGAANVRNNQGSVGIESLDITTGSNDYYLVANVSIDNTVPSQLQIEEGERTTYEAPNTNIYIDLADDVFPDVTPEKTTFIKRNTKNLFDGELHNLWIVGSPERVGIPSNPTWQSIIVKVDPNATHSVRFKDPLTYFRVWQFDKYPEPNKDIAYIGTNGFHNTDFTRITTRSDAEYMMITVTDIDGDGEIHEDVIVERGYDTNPPYELDTDKIQVEPPKNHFITSHVSGNYEQIGDNMTIVPSDHDDFVGLVYSIWDEMMNDFPDYITKKYMWSEPVDNLPVYKYTFKPPLPDTVQNLGTIDDIEFEKILVISNIHAYEKIAAGQVITFFQELVYNWRTSDVLSMLRWNIQFDVFAVYNPYGLQYQQRRNGNGVDLNENFNIKWGNKYPADHMQYAGPSALSEYENQQFDKYLDEHNDYMFAVDFHQSNNYEMMGYVVATKTATESVRKLLVGVASQMNQYSKANYPEIVGDDNSSDFYLVQEGGDKGRMYQFLDKKGIPSLIYETSTNDITMPTDACYKMGVTTIGNLFLSAVRFRDELKVIEKDFGD